MPETAAHLWSCDVPSQDEATPGERERGAVPGEDKCSAPEREQSAFGRGGAAERARGPGWEPAADLGEEADEQCLDDRRPYDEDGVGALRPRPLRPSPRRRRGAAAGAGVHAAGRCDLPSRDEVCACRRHRQRVAGDRHRRPGGGTARLRGADVRSIRRVAPAGRARPQPPVADEVSREAFTTVANWRLYGSADYNGVFLGQKAHALRPLIHFPRRSRAAFALALSIDADEPDVAALEHHGWSIVDPIAAAGTPDRYRQFVRGSRAEIGIAKSGYIATSADGSATEAPATSLGPPGAGAGHRIRRLLPAGEGLLTFRTTDAVLAAIDGCEATTLGTPRGPSHGREAPRLGSRVDAAARLRGGAVAYRHRGARVRAVRRGRRGGSRLADARPRCGT